MKGNFFRKENLTPYIFATFFTLLKNYVQTLICKGVEKVYDLLNNAPSEYPARKMTDTL